MKTMEYLCVAQRRASHSRETGKKLWEEAKKKQKSADLPRGGKLKKKKKNLKAEGKVGRNQWRPALPLPCSRPYYWTTH